MRRSCTAARAVAGACAAAISALALAAGTPVAVVNPGFESTKPDASGSITGTGATLHGRGTLWLDDVEVTVE